MLAVLMSSTMFAQPGNGNGNGKGNGYGKGNCYAALNLSDEQEQQIEKLRTAHQKEILPLRNQLGEMEAKLRTLTTGDKVDMALVNKQIEDISTVKLTLAKKREAHRQDVRKLLTDDQRVQFDMHSGKGNRGNGNPGRGGMRMDPQGNCDGSGPGRNR